MTYTPLPELLKSYVPYDTLEASQVTQLTQFLADSKNPYDRSNLVTHVVADAWVVNKARDAVLLMYHAYKDVWITAGGHCDGDPDVAASAVREVQEETGLTELIPLEPFLFDINCGYVPLREKPHGIEPLHLHFDACFLFEGDDRVALTPNEESVALKWVPFAELAGLKMFDEHRRRVHKTLARWEKQKAA